MSFLIMEYELNDLRWWKQQETTVRPSAFCGFYNYLSFSGCWDTLVVGSVHLKCHWYVCDWSLLPTYYAWNSKKLDNSIVIRIAHKQNNAEFTNVSSFTSLLVCSTHFTLPCRILLFLHPTTNNFFKFVYFESPESLPGKSCLGSQLWQLKVIRTWLASILDLWYPGPCQLTREVLVLYFVWI